MARKAINMGDSVFEKAEPSLSDLHVSRPLTDVSVGYSQDEGTFITPDAFAKVMSDKRTNEYFIFDAGDFHRDEAAERAPGDESEGSGYGMTRDSFTCRRYSYHKDIPSEDLAEEDEAAEVETTATELVTQKGLIRQERAAAAAFFVTGVWATDIEGVASGPGAGEAVQWDKAGSTPFEDCEARCNGVVKSIGLKPNFAIFGADAWKVVKNHADFVDRIKHTSGEPLTEQMVAKLLGLEDLLVGRAVHNTAAKGQTASNAFIWDSRSVLLGYRNKTPSRRRVSAGYLFTHNGYYGAGKGVRVKRLEMPLRDSVRIEMDIAFVPKVVASSAAAFLHNIVSTDAAT